MQTFINMWRSVTMSKRFLLHMEHMPRYCRTFLSEAYACEEAWNKRFDSSLLQRVNTTDMFVELDRKFAKNTNVSSVDVDIFINALKSDEQIEEVIDLITRLRLTTETSNTLPSTHHALIRYFMKFGKIKQLLDILEDRLTFGIFPDYVCYNLLMDTCIKNKDFASAARTASLLMLQEDFDNPISNALVLYSCHKYLENPGDWKAKEIIKDEPEEEVKVRVKYLRNPYFDDHFDLREPSDLVGKTLFLYGKHLGGPEGRSCQLRGLLLYKKYLNSIELIEEWIQKDVKDIIYHETLSLIKKDVPGIFEEEMNDEIRKVKDLLLKLENMNLKQGSLTEALEQNINAAVNQQEKTDISQQCMNYVTWEERRMSILKEHLAELERQNKKKQFAEMKKELESRERILTYFDKEEEIELAIEEKLKKEEEMYGHIKKLKVISSDEYIPPEISKRREV